jgi:hypothetical protein
VVVKPPFALAAWAVPASVLPGVVPGVTVWIYVVLVSTLLP